MITAGLDIGSVATKAVVCRDGVVLARAVTRSSAAPRQAAEAVLNETIAKAGISRTDIAAIGATGYGRRAVGIGDKIVTEISADARGAYSLGTPWGKPRLVVDLGGQDTKVILLEKDGTVLDFRMNDKCAAGTGRFVEVMGGVLGVKLEDMGALSARSRRPATINSTCTVFAESEVISLIAGGTTREDIVAGIHNAIASRIATMLRQMGDFDVLFNGGGACNSGICSALEAALKRRVHVPQDPQYVVALGAALLAS